MGVVRIKPLGVGGGGVENSAKNGKSSISFHHNQLHVQDKPFTFPKMVISPDTSQS